MSPSESVICRALRLRLLIPLLLAAACGSTADEVCQDIGDCSQGGSTSWITACQSEAKVLGAEAADGGCGATFDSYFSCARSAYSCRGATATFPGCDDRHAALDACLAAATRGTSCAALVAAEASCASSSSHGGDAGVDAGSGTGGITGTALPPACTASRDCQAHCYLSAVANACAPGVDELEAISACTGACPL
jgi:hypothetical protein